MFNPPPLPKPRPPVKRLDLTNLASKGFSPRSLLTSKQPLSTKNSDNKTLFSPKSSIDSPGLKIQIPIPPSSTKAAPGAQQNTISKRLSTFLNKKMQKEIFSPIDMKDCEKILLASPRNEDKPPFKSKIFARPTISLPTEPFSIPIIISPANQKYSKEPQSSQRLLLKGSELEMTDRPQKVILPLLITDENQVEIGHKEKSHHATIFGKLYEEEALKVYSHKMSGRNKSEHFHLPPPEDLYTLNIDKIVPTSPDDGATRIKLAAKEKVSSSSQKIKHLLQDELSCKLKTEKEEPAPVSMRGELKDLANKTEYTLLDKQRMLMAQTSRRRKFKSNLDLQVIKCFQDVQNSAKESLNSSPRLSLYQTFTEKRVLSYKKESLDDIRGFCKGISAARKGN